MNKNRQESGDISTYGRVRIPPGPPLLIVNHFYLDVEVYLKRILHGYRQQHRESESRVPGPQLQGLHEQRGPRPHAEART